MYIKNRKNNIYRRLFSLIVVCFFFTSMAISTIAVEQTGICGDNLTWTLSGDTLTITGSGEMLEYSDGAFPGWYGRREEIRSIVLPSGLTTISDFAFFGCTNVTSVNIPSSVTYIGEYAFAQCTALMQVDLGTGVQTIGDGVFQECESLMVISFPASLTSIGAKAFYRCYNLQTLTIPSTVEYIGSSAFAYCQGLVRATVDAPLEQLPDWTFYGCDSLSDVSLAASIVSVGDFAFQLCGSLNGIYTQAGDVDTAYKLEQSITQEEGAPAQGIVGIYEMPETSVVTKDDGKVFSETKVMQREETVVSIEKATDYSQAQNKTSTTVAALVDESRDWANIAEVMDENMPSAADKPVVIQIQLLGTTVKAEELAQFAGKSVLVRVTTGGGVIWEIDMSELSADDFSGDYDLSVVILEKNEEEIQIASDRIFQVEFSDRIDFNATIGLKEGTVYKLATLYQNRGREYEVVQTIVVDTNNYAWFSLANIDKRTDYYIALNVEGITMEDAVIPTTMFQQYELDEESHLMDKDGVVYRITGRTSKWGITGSQFSIYLAVGMAVVILVVGIVMTGIHVVKRSKENYRRLVEEDTFRDDSKQDIDEEALRMDIMRELLEQKSKDSGKSAN